MSLVNYATYLKEGDRVRQGDRTGTVVETKRMGALYGHRIQWDGGRRTWVYDTDRSVTKEEQ